VEGGESALSQLQNLQRNDMTQGVGSSRDAYFDLANSLQGLAPQSNQTASSLGSYPTSGYGSGDMGQYSQLSPGLSAMLRTPDSVSSLAQHLQTPQQSPLAEVGAMQTPGIYNPSTMSAAPDSVSSLYSGHLQTPQQFESPSLVQVPQLQPGASLEYLNQNTMGYTPTDYSMFDLGQASPISVPNYGGGGYGSNFGGQNSSAGGMNINSGIQVPQMPSAPSTPQMGSVAGMGGAGMAGMSAGYGQAMQPQMMGLMGQYQQNAANLGLTGQQAQADAGLGWGSLAQQMSQNRQQYNTGTQGNTLGFLGSLYRMMG
jgi:hypothetical protein